MNCRRNVCGKKGLKNLLAKMRARAGNTNNEGKGEFGADWESLSGAGTLFQGGKEMNPTVQNIIQTIQAPVLIVLNIWIAWQLVILVLDLLNEE